MQCHNHDLHLPIYFDLLRHNILRVLVQAQAVLMVSVAVSHSPMVAVMSLVQCASLDCPIRQGRTVQHFAISSHSGLVEAHHTSTMHTGPPGNDGLTGPEGDDGNHGATGATGEWFGAVHGAGAPMNYPGHAQFTNAFASQLQA